MTPLDHFIHTLQNTALPPHTANPYLDHAECIDIDDTAPGIRTRQLRQYLSARLNTARILLVAEAKGYQGGRFTGVPLASERMLLGRQKEIPPTYLLPHEPAEQTSNKTISPQGFREPTATIVWKALLELEVPPFEVVTWNIFPFHPYKPDEGPLTNRTPTKNELEIGGEIFKQFLTLFPTLKLIASVGRKAEQTLNTLNIANTPLRHPANGGANQFREGLRVLISHR